MLVMDYSAVLQVAMNCKYVDSTKQQKIVQSYKMAINLTRFIKIFLFLAKSI